MSTVSSSASMLPMMVFEPMRSVPPEALLSWFPVPVKVISAPTPESLIPVVPATVASPPRVVRPVPVVIGLLVVVFIPSVVAEVRSMIVELPVKFIAVEARDVVAPDTVKLPPVITSPVPKGTGLFVVVLMPSVVALVRSSIGEEPVRVMAVEAMAVLVPFKDIAPVPVLKVLAPVCEKVLVRVVAPAMPTAPVRVEAPVIVPAPSTISAPLAEIFPALEIVTPVDP